MGRIHDIRARYVSGRFTEQVSFFEKTQECGLLAQMRHSMIEQKISDQREGCNILPNVKCVAFDSCRLIRICRFRNHFREKLELGIYVYDGCLYNFT